MLLEDLLTRLWDQDKWLGGNSPGRQPERAHHQGHQQADEVPVPGDEHIQNNCGKDGVEDESDILKSPLHLPAWTATLPTAARGRRFGSRRTSREVWKKKIRAPTSPDCNSFDYFAGGVSELRVIANPPKNQRPDPLHHGGNGVPHQEHRGEVLQEIQVPDRCCRRCWWQFHWINWFSVRFLPTQSLARK